jgi:hypothetical protein
MAQVKNDQDIDTHAKVEDFSSSSEDKLEAGQNAPGENSVTWNWDDDSSNPYNWPTRLKVQQVFMIASAALTTWVTFLCDEMLAWTLTWYPGLSAYRFYRPLTRNL